MRSAYHYDGGDEEGDDDGRGHFDDTTALPLKDKGDDDNGDP